MHLRAYRFHSLEDSAKVIAGKSVLRQLSAGSAVNRIRAAVRFRRALSHDVPA